MIRCSRVYHDDFLFTNSNLDPDLRIDRQPALKQRWEFLEPERQLHHASVKTLILGQVPQTIGGVLDLGHIIRSDAVCSRGG